MMKRNFSKLLATFSALAFLLVAGLSCNKSGESGKNNEDPNDKVIAPPYSIDEFVMGVDLSYLNQILDKNGIYDGGKDPYQVFKEAGTNLVRLRLWHSPTWVRDLYQDQSEKLYSGLEDVIDASLKVKDLGLDICIDFHYSDNWADPGKQVPPQAWKDLDLETLKDSLYDHTYNSLNRLKMLGIIPAFVQIGNEINSGFLHPTGHFESNDWNNLGVLLNAGIKAVRDLYEEMNQPKIIIHVAQPENIRWFFTNLTILGQVTDFEIIGLSYYSKWSNVGMQELDGYIRTARSDFHKELMLVETAFPWTVESVDSYNNIFSGMELVPGYDTSPQGQLKYMKDLCQEIIDGGGMGVIYWEPGWISSDIITQWGSGSAWENCSFFDFTKNNSPLPVFEYLMFYYNFDK